jgi:hypothetical protein
MYHQSRTPPDRMQLMIIAIPVSVCFTDIVNVMTLAYLWLFPSSSKLLIACYCLSHGPLCTAIATWRNSLVFHSVDKVTSLFIHVYPPFVFTVLRHFYPNAGEKYPALNSLDTLNVWKSLLFSSIACE